MHISRKSDLNEQPSNGSFLLRGRNQVSDTEQPVREVEARDAVFFGDGSLEDMLPSGIVYVVRYIDETEREVFVSFDGHSNLKFDKAVFLKDGRTTNLLREIWKLKIPNTEEAVPHHVIDKLKKYQENRERLAQTGQLRKTYDKS